MCGDGRAAFGAQETYRHAAYWPEADIAEERHNTANNNPASRLLTTKRQDIFRRAREVFRQLNFSLLGIFP